MVQLKRTAGRLLKLVGGQPHARREDHDDEFGIQSEMTKEEEDALINADPISSDEEPIESTPPIPTSKPATVISNPSKTSKTSKQGDGANSYAQKSGHQSGIRPPKPGLYEIGKASKERRTTKDGGTENNRPDSQSSKSKRTAETEEDNGIVFDFSQSAPLKRQRVPQTMSKIHTRTGRPQVPKMKTTYQSKTSRANDTFDDGFSDSSDVSMKSLPEEIKARQRRRKNSKEESALPVPQASTVERASMLDTLAKYRHDATPTSSQIHASPSKESAASTPISSLDSPGLTLDDSMFADGLTSDRASEDKCPLCGEPVRPEHYREFWKSRKMTVRHQSTFCHDHHKREAQVEYKKLGYPEIDWDALPMKIEKHYPRLTAIVRNKPGVPSTYRDLYAERAEAGERQNVSKMIEENTNAMTKTGYYGARGHRMFMESITNHLSDVIRDCALEDSTVTHGGMANFVLHVLVPELTIRLIMDESSVSESMAKQIIEESGEIGAKVHEEDGDTIERADSEDDNET